MIARALYVLLCLAAIAGLFNEIGATGHLILVFLVISPILARLLNLLIVWLRQGFSRSERPDAASNDYLLEHDLRRRAKRPQPRQSVSADLFIIVAGAVMAVVSVWGFVQSAQSATHGPSWFIFPLFWGVFDLFLPFIRRA
jgi:hypothetical protein